MSDQAEVSNLKNQIGIKESPNVTLVSEEENKIPAHSIILTGPSTIKKPDEEKAEEVPQYKEIPDHLKEHFPKDHVLLNIKPDGNCGVTCGSAHIFAQPTQGKEFRIVINKYMVSHWEFCKNKISFPYERQVGVGGKIVKFNDPMEFQNFLQSSDADFLWTDGEEIQVMCNMYQMGATVVKVGNNEKNPPTILHAGPDNDIKKLGLPNTVHIEPGKVPHMFLLLKGAHYDLAVPKDTIKEKYEAQPKVSLPCQKCPKVFQKERARDLHMNSNHNEKAHQYTPGIAKRKVGRPTTRFTCTECKNNLGNENDLRKHMIIHKYPKRTRSDLKLEPLQRVASITKSPPKKRVKEVESNKNSDTKDIIISNLETRNANLLEATERKQEMINKQATIIGGFKTDLEAALLALAVRDATITELRLAQAATDVNRDIGTTPNKEDIPPVGGQDQAGPPADLAVPSGGEPPSTDEMFLADEGRWENMVTHKEKMTQKHCALDPRGPDDCTFQCNSKEELDRHMTKKHMIMCTVCPQEFNKIEDLASHMESDHKNEINQSHDLNGGPTLKCIRCASNFTTRRELTTHIKEEHKSYKPCDYFLENSCELDDNDCRFNHIKLAQGQQICYTCGDKFKSKRDMISHIKADHGNTVCYKFLQNKCTVRRCFFKHIIHSVPNVEKSPEAPPALSDQDFPSLPTTGPVVWRQVAAEDTQARVLPNLLDGTQNKNKALEAQVLQTLTIMMPQITQQLVAALRAGMTTN